VTPAERDNDLLILQMMRRREVMHVVCNNKPVRIPVLVTLAARTWRDQKLAGRLLKRTVLQMVDEGALLVGDDYLVRLGPMPATEQERVLRFVRDVWGHDSLHEQIVHTTSRMRRAEFTPRAVITRMRGRKPRPTAGDVMGAMMWLTTMAKAYEMTFIFRGEQDHVLDMHTGIAALAPGFVYTDPSGKIFSGHDLAERLYPVFKKKNAP